MAERPTDVVEMKNLPVIDPRISIVATEAVITHHRVITIGVRLIVGYIEIKPPIKFMSGWICCKDEIIKKDEKEEEELILDIYEGILKDINIGLIKV